MPAIWIAFGVYVLFSAYYTHQVFKAPLSRKQKIINVFMVWIVPFIWGILIKTMSRPITEKDKKIDRSTFNESGIGDNV